MYPDEVTNIPTVSGTLRVTVLREEPSSVMILCNVPSTSLIWEGEDFNRWCLHWPILHNWIQHLVSVWRIVYVEYKMIHLSQVLFLSQTKSSFLWSRCLYHPFFHNDLRKNRSFSIHWPRAVHKLIPVPALMSYCGSTWFRISLNTTTKQRTNPREKELKKSLSRVYKL